MQQMSCVTQTCATSNLTRKMKRCWSKAETHRSDILILAVVVLLVVQAVVGQSRGPGIVTCRRCGTRLFVVVFLVVFLRVSCCKLVDNLQDTRQAKNLQRQRDGLRRVQNVLVWTAWARARKGNEFGFGAQRNTDTGGVLDDAHESRVGSTAASVDNPTA